MGTVCSRYRSCNSHRNGPYFSNFSSSFFSHFKTQLISTHFLLLWFTINSASILLACNSWFSPLVGISHNAWTASETYSVLGLIGEYHTGRLSTSCNSRSSSKYNTFSALLCLAKYLFWIPTSRELRFPVPYYTYDRKRYLTVIP